MKSHQKQLEGLYNQKLWVPIAEKRKIDPSALPEYFDGIAEWVEFLRLIIHGAK